MWPGHIGADRGYGGAGIRGVGATITPTSVTGPLLAALPLLVVPLLLRWLLGPSRTVRLLIGGACVVAVARLLWFDPLLDRRCVDGCTPSPLALLASSSSESVLRVAEALVPVLCALVGVVIARRFPVPVRSACAGLLVASGMRAAAICSTPSSALKLSWNILALVASAAAVVFAVGVAGWPSVRRLRARLAVARLVRRLSGARDIDDVSAAVARALADPTAEVRYRSPTGWVDARGADVRAPGPEAVEVRRGGGVIAAIVTPRTSGRAPTAVRLGPTLELALANEQLRALALARVQQLRLSRARIVAAGDAARRGLEQNLHDGAQQRLVALTFELRRARARAEGVRAVELDAAIAIATAALEELREIAHGIFPATLTEAGLSAALHELAGASVHAVSVVHIDDERLPADVAIAAYCMVAEVIEHSPAAIDVRRRDGDTLVVRLTVPGRPPTDSTSDAADRVGALGGTILTTRGENGTEIQGVLPCAL